MNSKSLKIILGILLLMFLCVFLFAFKYKSDIDAKRFYKQGMFFYEQKKYSDAYYNFKQVNRFSDLYVISLLKQYMCADKLEDKKTARSRLTELTRSTNDENIKAYAAYQEAIIASDIGIDSKNQSFKKFKKILNTHPNSNFYYASAYKAAMLSDDKYYAKEKYIEYLEYAPIGKFALSALNSIKEYEDILLKRDKEIIADSYYLNSKYKEALKYYQETEFSRNWFKISKCYRQLNQKEDEKIILTNGLNLRQSDIDEKDIDSAINRLIEISGYRKMEFLQELYSKSAGAYIYPTVVYNLAEINQSIHSIKLYEQIVKGYPNSIWASNSLWEIFWYNYSLNRYNTCIKIGEIHQKKYSKSADAPRVAYWSAIALLKEKRNQDARELFYKIIKEYPLSYYAFLSARQLKISKARKIIVKKPLPDFDINSLNKYIFKNDKILLFLANNNDWELIDELKINDEYIKAWVMYKKGNYPNAINTAKNEYLKQIKENEEIKSSYSDKELKLIYPVLYGEDINKYALEYSQSPYLFLSIIKEESHFNKDAQSPAGAVGLVQIMPATASFIEKTQIDSETLKKDNIRIGLKYFDYLVNLFDKNEYLAILSYNAGPGNIKKWQDDSYIKSDNIDEFVENIPYLETKNYIKKVLSSYWIYFNIYK